MSISPRWYVLQTSSNLISAMPVGSVFLGLGCKHYHRAAQRLLVGGRKGFLMPDCAVCVSSPTTPSCPSARLSAPTDVLTPSVAPISTSTGRTNSPSFNQMTPRGSACASLLLSLAPVGFHVRKFCDTSDSEVGSHRKAAAGTTSAFSSFCTTKCTLAVR